MSSVSGQKFKALVAGMRSFTERSILKLRSLSKSTPMRPVRGIEPRAGSAVGTKNALIIVVSQDGAVRYVDSLNGKVIYWELGPFKPRAVQPVFLRNTDRHPVPRRSDLLNYSQFRFGARRLWLLVAATPRWEKCRLQAPKGSCYLRFGLTSSRSRIILARKRSPTDTSVPRAIRPSSRSSSSAACNCKIGRAIRIP
jgi:hypothetical protein